ncbi:MAG: hypothetical protein KME42_16115 [Tildeniella nuda ZEHNDER 1965/U140]|nr:hypothetical protein [Tildeniella nuda ZEHNDER 1965/U140]
MPSEKLAIALTQYSDAFYGRCDRTKPHIERSQPDQFGCIQSPYLP